MAVPSLMTDLSTSEASNNPADSDSVTAATRPSDYLRAHAAILRTLAASDTIAAGATVDLSTKANTFITITGGATTINALGTVAAGIYKWVIYNAAHTLTHNGTSLILLGGVNRTVAAGDASLFVSEGSGNWRELSFGDASGYQPLDADLTAIAALTTQAYGRSLLEVANEAALKALINLEIGTDVLAYVAPGTSGNVLTSNGSAWTSATPQYLTSGTAQASTSGTSIDFTGIPAGTKRITISLSGVSTSGTSNPLIQIGDSGGVETTNYLGSSCSVQNGGSTVGANYTTGFGISAGLAANLAGGTIVLTLIDAASFLWAASGIVGYSNGAYNVMVGGSKALSAELDRVRITTVNGTDTFDAGTINILYE